MLAVLAAGVIVTSCKRDFDQPPSFVEPNIQANTTIKALKAMHVIGAIEKISQDLVIGGVVVADDKSGNFYKSIAIQDETGGITVRLDGTNLNTSYPVGRKIYIKLNGLYMGDYNRLIQIGGGIDDTDPSRPELAPIASTLFDRYILKGSLNNTITPKVVTVAQLHDSLQSMLIQLNNMEFVVADTSKTYADVVTQQSRNINIKGCGGNSVVVRTSGFANFAGINVPNGNGTLLAVYTMFGNTKQLLIRDTSDVRFTGPRCGAGPTTVMNISDVRALFAGTTTSAPDGRRITGIVISDRTTSNLNGQNLILQQGNGQAGIVVRFDAPHTFDLGDSIDVNISGQEISEFNRTLQVNNVPVGFATRISTGKSITPRVATLTQIATSFDTWESTLVTINNINLTGSGTYNGSVTLNDGTGTLTMFTAAGATFAGQTYPATATSVTGYLSEFNATKQLAIRRTADVVGSGGAGGSTLLDENFEGTTASSDIALTGWTNLAETGTEKYESRLFSSNKYAQISAFGTNQAVVKSWLVTKGVSLDNTTNERLTFDSKAGFANGATLKVFVSTNYTGTGNPWAAGVTWTEVTSQASLSPGLTSGYPANFTGSGNINLNTYSGTIYVAFVYEGADPTGTANDKTTTWQIDNVKIIGN